ncbi:hypothetical protein I302_101702 [Kwoniella bestiolae CBS 10118]|uniref:Uncharacterized protein n=1 Tax=Kwoniella bestiolae CBS 10118 TaxID=1296100 RepID=A0A1B9GCZ0_9TREE|nr:hypothetical protein I302_00378 [Kwoniella bestiolae CBS 10118]OCF28888.1 hypothetical protein I302_00378 [Kwoniella bestiolae CBS 10118]
MIQPNDPTNDHPTIFEFPYNSPEGSQDKSKMDKKEFIWDIYDREGCTSFEGGRGCQRLYRLNCHIEVDKTFRGNAEFALRLTSPYVALTSEDLTAKEAVSVVCPKSQGQCAVAGLAGEAEKNLCEQMPGWDDQG